MDVVVNKTNALLATFFFKFLKTEELPDAESKVFGDDGCSTKKGLFFFCFFVLENKKLQSTFRFISTANIS